MIERPRDVRIEKSDGRVIPCELSYAGEYDGINVWALDTELNLTDGDTLHVGFFPARTTLAMPTQDDTVSPRTQITTRRTRRKEFWREKVVPTLWLTAMAIAIAIILGLGCIAQASPGESFAQTHADEICAALEERPTVPTVVGLLFALETYGLSSAESGVAVAESVIGKCPMYEVLLRQFIHRYRHLGTVGVIA